MVDTGSGSSCTHLNKVSSAPVFRANMWNGAVNEGGELVLQGTDITILLAGIGDADAYLKGTTEGGVGLEDIRKGWHLGVQVDFVKKVQMRLDKMAHAGKSTV